MPGMRSRRSLRQRLPVALAALAMVLTFSTPPHSAFALTEPEKQQEAEQPKDPAAAEQPESQDDVNGSDSTLPMPDSLLNRPGDDTAVGTDEPDIPSEIIVDLTTLPEPVQKLRVALVEAAASGDIERLRPLLGTGEDQTQVSIGEAPDDPIAALKSLSGDPDGREVLAILLDIISTSPALVDKGTQQETYVWPYFAEKNLDSLTPPEIVELYRIVTAGDVADMKEFGGYNFYRLGIGPDGKWKFFVAGD